ncbi:hypothetical protein B0H10DRAFT_2385398 [Mycena sp. CBHHK59/15]|nr:hypothetical protein B0H10DRAFT_2385398 [Mycena sp. CBHHK59/15]
MPGRREFCCGIWETRCNTASLGGLGSVFADPGSDFELDIRSFGGFSLASARTSAERIQYGWAKVVRAASCRRCTPCPHTSRFHVLDVLVSSSGPKVVCNDLAPMLGAGRRVEWAACAGTLALAIQQNRKYFLRPARGAFSARTAHSAYSALGVGDVRSGRVDARANHPRRCTAYGPYIVSRWRGCASRWWRMRGTWHVSVSPWLCEPPTEQAPVMLYSGAYRCIDPVSWRAAVHHDVAMSTGVRRVGSVGAARPASLSHSRW